MNFLLKFLTGLKCSSWETLKQCCYGCFPAGWNWRLWPTQMVKFQLGGKSIISVSIPCAGPTLVIPDQRESPSQVLLNCFHQRYFWKLSLNHSIKCGVQSVKIICGCQVAFLLRMGSMNSNSIWRCSGILFTLQISGFLGF